ncbi:hypothetical protein GQ44DRAFT_662351, partial [Phaeosphaeriaceae sp. PMI808]
MSEKTPSVRTVEKDGDGPVKQRRRPAFSCVECRSRKVRCDRRKPCGACTRRRSMTCTYRPQRPGIRESSPAAVSGSGNSNGSGHRNSARSSPLHSTPTDEFDHIVSRNIAPGAPGENDRTKVGPPPANQPSLSLSTHPGPGSSALIKQLLGRIHKLESKEVARSGSSESTNPPILEGSTTEAGQFLKSKFYGQSHWVNSLDPVCNSTMNSNTKRREVNKRTELYATVTKVKQMSRVIKTSRMLQPTISPDVQASVPQKGVCDALVECYLRTFEGVFRVLHVPTFRKECEGYWAGIVSQKPSVILKILLVCAIGVPFYTGPDQPQLRASCSKWIQAATQWLNGPHAKSRLNMAGLQIQILALIARQVCSIDGDHIWVPAGSLLRAAMHLGLHRDPEHYDNISIYHCEMRRRLWATILEITAQSSLDMGMPPMISNSDYDTKPPSNIDDEDIAEDRNTPLEEKPLTEFTDSRMQIAFADTLPTRLEIIRLINNLRFDLSYDKVLKISNELNNTCREHTIFLKSALNTRHNITPFQIKMVDSLVRRFILCLHRPYFAKAKENPQYHFSRKMCLDTSLILYTPAIENTPGQQDDWTKMTHQCVGFFKSFFLYAMSTVYLELLSQLDEQKHAAAIFAPLITTHQRSSSACIMPIQFQALRDVLALARGITLARIRNGETNAKGFVFLCCALARIDAIVSGADEEHAVLEAGKKSVKE